VGDLGVKKGILSHIHGFFSNINCCNFTPDKTGKSCCKKSIALVYAGNVAAAEY